MAKGRPTGAQTRPRWKHPDGMPLADVVVGAFYDGTITNVSPGGIWVDFGAVKDGLIRLQTKGNRAFRRGMELRRLRVASCDVALERIVMEMEDESLLQPTQHDVQESAGSAAKQQIRARSAPPPSTGLSKGYSSDGSIKPAARQGARSVTPMPRRTAVSGARTKLEDLSEGTYIDGVVKNVNKFGVFVDIGAESDARLAVPFRIGSHFQRGHSLQNCHLDWVDPENRRIQVSLEDAAALADSLSTQASSKSSAPIGSKDKDTKLNVKRSPAPALPAGASISMEEVEEGSFVTGVVRNVGKYGVFLDIGADCDARLSVPTRIGRRFQRGNTLPNCHVDWVNPKLRRIQVSLDDPESVLEQLQQPQQNATKSQDTRPARENGGKLKQQAPAATAPATVPSTMSGRAPSLETSQPRGFMQTSGSSIALDQIVEGSLVDGVVTNAGSSGVFVDIGYARDALLDVPRNVWNQFRRGDEIMGMTVDMVERERGWITVTIEAPELTVEGDKTSLPPRQQHDTAWTNKTAKGASNQSLPTLSASWGNQEQAAPSRASGPSNRVSPPPRSSTPDSTKNNLKIGDSVDGKVSWAGIGGVYVTIDGAEGCLDVPAELVPEFREGDQVLGMCIESVDRRTGWLSLSLEEPRLDVEGPPAATGGDRGTDQSRGRSSGSHEWVPPRGNNQSSPMGPPLGRRGYPRSRSDAGLRKLRLGTEVNGTVTRVGSSGVFVGFGAEIDGRLQVSWHDAKKFQVGDEVEGMVIDEINADEEEVVLKLPYELGDTPFEGYTYQEPPPQGMCQSSCGDGSRYDQSDWHSQGWNYSRSETGRSYWDSATMMQNVKVR